MLIMMMIWFISEKGACHHSFLTLLEKPKLTPDDFESTEKGKMVKMVLIMLKVCLPPVIDSMDY